MTESTQAAAWTGSICATSCAASSYCSALCTEGPAAVPVPADSCLCSLQQGETCAASQLQADKTLHSNALLMCVQ
jgi:hypothetical protein